MKNKQKKNIFSENPWNDTPYYDPFVEEWVKYGIFDINSSYRIRDKNKVRDNEKLTKHACFKWPERI